jgi:hypothetical protein
VPSFTCLRWSGSRGALLRLGVPARLRSTNVNLDRLQLNRRTFLGLSGTTLAAAACGGSTASVATETAATRWFSETTVIANAQPQRTIWGLSDEQGNLGDQAPDETGVKVFDSAGTQIHSSTAAAHRDGVALPYYPVMVEFPTPGSYEFAFTTSVGAYVGFTTAIAPADNQLILVGDHFPSVVTPTLSNAAGVDPICTRNPVCPFHDHSIDQVLGDGTPIVLIISTPAFCGTTWMCGPVLEILIEHSADLADRAHVIHAEVYSAPRPDDLGALAPILEVTRATYEPFLFTIDGDGEVRHRLDHIWDRAELSSALATL